MRFVDGDGVAVVEVPGADGEHGAGELLSFDELLSGELVELFYVLSQLSDLRRPTSALRPCLQRACSIAKSRSTEVNDGQRVRAKQAVLISEDADKRVDDSSRSASFPS